MSKFVVGKCKSFTKFMLILKANLYKRLALKACTNHAFTFCNNSFASRWIVQCCERNFVVLMVCFMEENYFIQFLSFHSIYLHFPVFNLRWRLNGSNGNHKLISKLLAARFSRLNLPSNISRISLSRFKKVWSLHPIKYFMIIEKVYIPLFS